MSPSPGCEKTETWVVWDEMGNIGTVELLTVELLMRKRLERWNGSYPNIGVVLMRKRGNTVMSPEAWTPVWRPRVTWQDYVHNQSTVAPPTHWHVRNYDTRIQATTVTVASSILTDVEIETDPSISYPTLEVFMAKLDDEEPGRRWSEIFLRPLRWMGVRTIDDMCIVSPESLSGFFNLSPIMVMDFYVHIVDALFALQARKSLSIYQLNRQAQVSEFSSHWQFATNSLHGVSRRWSLWSLEAPLSSTDRWVVKAREKDHGVGGKTQQYIPLSPGLR
ncbi:hypothetical protein CY34DRAFT_107812 [Suillus luteus UH-Slu-Lm8-n1]|uniref:Uncharacterized protein n=1 Tax=Suillus luteus UH-Slu-Lm8-n1 TaxID=930992 RepID=A0A0D0AQJ5_9AGAM|nr:hypothetical protein CY34DRAFT_107812 [Suillus luteus UH-Slu-Lm8-n1]